MNTYKIVLSGNAGSGKSTIGKLLAQNLDIEFLSVGDICRKKALSMGMDINQFQEYLKTNNEFDQAMDSYIAEHARSLQNYVLDYRLGFFFLPESFKVFLRVSDEVAVNRISNRNGADENLISGYPRELVLLLKRRNGLMRQRFIEVYNADFIDERNYDLVLDTNQLAPEDILNEIIEALRVN